MFTRERHRRGVVYFGPYANAKKVRETLDVLNRVFPYRPCEGPKPGRHSGIPCLDYHIERCLAPCVGYVTKEAYREVIDGVIEFLSGETRPIQRELERRMNEAAADERFEEAARHRNRLFAVQHLAERQAADRRAVGTVDVLGLAIEADRAAVQVFPLRDGKMVDRYAFHLENVDGQDAAHDPRGLLPRVLRLVARACRHSSSSRAGSATSDALAEFLSSRRGSRVEIRAAERGDKRRLQELATQNAVLALEAEAAGAESRRIRRVEALEELREALNLESLPLRIECFDISTTMGEENVGSMVVFQDGQPKKAHYRKFAVRGQVGMDDFAAMAEIVSRRFARLAGPAGEDYDEGFAATPNLVVVDGGKGQLSAALEAIQAYELPRVAVIALAKRVEEVFVPGQAGADRARPPLAGPPAAAARPRRGAPLRDRLQPAAARDARVQDRLRRSAGCRPRATARAAAALRLAGARSLPRARRSSKECPACRQRPPASCTRSYTGPAGREARAPCSRSSPRSRSRCLPPRRRSVRAPPSSSFWPRRRPGTPRPSGRVSRP